MERELGREVKWVLTVRGGVECSSLVRIYGGSSSLNPLQGRLGRTTTSATSANLNHYQLDRVGGGGRGRVLYSTIVTLGNVRNSALNNSPTGIYIRIMEG